MKIALLCSDVPALRDGGILKGPCFLCLQATAFTYNEKASQVTCLSLLSLLFEVAHLIRMMASRGTELTHAGRVLERMARSGRVGGMILFRYVPLLAD